MYLIYHYYICLAEITQDIFPGSLFFWFCFLKICDTNQSSPIMCTVLVDINYPIKGWCYRVLLQSHSGRNHILFMKSSREDSNAGFTEDFLLLIRAF